jgi:hypothetical protein
MVAKLTNKVPRKLMVLIISWAMTMIYVMAEKSLFILKISVLLKILILILRNFISKSKIRGAESFSVLSL